MDSNYRDTHPVKRSYDDLERENARLRDEVAVLRAKHRKLEHAIQDEVEQEILTGKPRFTGETNLDVLKAFGFEMHATLVTRNGDKIDLKKGV